MDLFGWMQPATALRMLLVVAVLDCAVLFLIPCLFCGQDAEPPMDLFLHHLLSSSSSSSSSNLEGLEKLEQALTLRVALVEEMGQHLAELRASIQTLKGHYAELQALSQTMELLEAATQGLQERMEMSDADPDAAAAADNVVTVAEAAVTKPKDTVGSARGSKSQ